MSISPTSMSSSVISPATGTDSSSAYSSSWHTTDYSESQATTETDFSFDRQSSGNNMSTATTHKRGNRSENSDHSSTIESSSSAEGHHHQRRSNNSSDHMKTDLIRAMTERRKRRKEAAFNKMKENLSSKDKKSRSTDRRNPDQPTEEYGRQDSFSSESISVPSGVLASTGDSVEITQNRSRNKSPLTLPSSAAGERLKMKRPTTPGQRASTTSSPSGIGGGNSSYGGSMYSLATSSDGDDTDCETSSNDTTQVTTDSGLRQSVAKATKSGYLKSMKGIVDQRSGDADIEENTVFLDRVEEEDDEDAYDSDTSIEIPLSERGLNGEAANTSRKPLRKKNFMKRKNKTPRSPHFQDQQQPQQQEEIVIADAYPVHPEVEAVATDAFYDNHHHHNSYASSYNESYGRMSPEAGHGGYYNPHDNSAGTLDSFFPRQPYTLQQQHEQEQYGVNKIVINPQHQLMMSKDLDSEYSSSLAPRQGSIDVTHLRRRQQWQRCVGACSVMVVLVVITAGIGAYFGLQMDGQQPDGDIDGGVNLGYTHTGPAEITHGSIDSYYNYGYGYGPSKIDRANSTGLADVPTLTDETKRGGINGTNITSVNVEEDEDIDEEGEGEEGEDTMDEQEVEEESEGEDENDNEEEEGDETEADAEEEDENEEVDEDEEEGDENEVEAEEEAGEEDEEAVEDEEESEETEEEEKDEEEGEEETTPEILVRNKERGWEGSPSAQNDQARRQRLRG